MGELPTAIVRQTLDAGLQHLRAERHRLAVRRIEQQRGNASEVRLLRGPFGDIEDAYSRARSQPSHRDGRRRRADVQADHEPLRTAPERCGHRAEMEDDVTGLRRDESSGPLASTRRRGQAPESLRIASDGARATRAMERTSRGSQRRLRHRRQTQAQTTSELHNSSELPANDDSRRTRVSCTIRPS